MYLYLDTRQTLSIHVSLLTAMGDVVRTVRIRSRQTAGGILAGISKALAAGKISAAQLDAVVVEQGPGGFSTLRAGVSIGNAVAFALKKKCIGLVTTVEPLKMRLDKALKGRVKYAYIEEPYYGSEPSITKPRKSI